MANNREDFLQAWRVLHEAQLIEENLAAFSFREIEGKTSLLLRTVGDARALVESLHRFLPDTDVKETPQKKHYYFLARDLRPGSGIVRQVNGLPSGPAGTLTCLLTSKDSQDVYFAGAGHVLTSFWENERLGDQLSIYRNIQGFPGTNSTLSLGKVFKASDPPTDISNIVNLHKPGAEIDIGIVRLRGTFDLKQRTTCYGTVGENGVSPYSCQKVMKCGAEEPHFTTAFVEVPEQSNIVVYGPDRKIYRFDKQVILSSTLPPECLPEPKVLQTEHPVQSCAVAGDSGSSALPPECPPETPIQSFAVAGDSGTIIVDATTREPVGMLIAGSILDGKYVMTPFKSIEKFWKRWGLVFRRA